MKAAAAIMAFLSGYRNRNDIAHAMMFDQEKGGTSGTSLIQKRKRSTTTVDGELLVAWQQPWQVCVLCQVRVRRNFFDDLETLLQSTTTTPSVLRSGLRVCEDCLSL